MQHVDVSVALVPGRTPVYPGDTELTVDRVQSRADGDPTNVSRLVCSTHCGTHVDAPAHLFDERPGVDDVPLETLLGGAAVHRAIRRADAGITILETLDPREVEPGWWTLTCLPLRLTGVDGAPARAVLSRPE